MHASLRRDLVTALLGAGLAQAAVARPPAQALVVEQYDCTFSGELIPIDFCDGNGCVPDDFKSVFVGGQINDFNVGSPDELFQFGFADFGNTDGGLKETSLVGAFEVTLDPPIFDAAGRFVMRQSASVSYSLDIGPDLYSADLGGSSTISTRFRVGGLPTDRYLIPITGMGGSVTTQPGQGFLTVHGITPGEYLFNTTTPTIFFDYICPACDLPDLPPDFPDTRDELTPRGSGGASLVDNTLTVSRNPDVGAWLEAGGGISGRAWAFVREIEAIVVGGTFVTAAGQTVNRVARWNGLEWAPLGQGLNGGVLALLEYQGSIIAGGGFTRAVGDNATPILSVARWDGTAWRPMGDGFNFRVNALATHEGSLYAAGNFTLSGATPMGRIARWNPSLNRWENAGNFNAEVQALLSVPYSATSSGGGSFLVAGGNFTTVNDTNARGIAFLELGQWTEPFPVTGVIETLHYQVTEDPFLGLISGFLFGGQFTAPGSINNIGLFQYDNFSISSLGAGVNGRVNSIYVHEPGPSSVVIAAGEFTSAGGQPASRIARWDTDRWSPVGQGFNDFVGAVTLFNGELFATGEFTASGSQSASRLARWTLDNPPPPPCPGDTNADGVVNFADLNAVLAAFGQTGPGIPADLNNDQAVNFADLNIVLSAFGNDCD